MGFDDSWALLLFHHLHGFCREAIHLDPGFQSLKRKILLTNWLRCLWSAPAKNWSSSSPDNSKKGTWRKKHKRINFPFKELNWKLVFGFSHPLLKAGCFGSLQVNVVHYVPDHFLSIDHIYVQILLCHDHHLHCHVHKSPDSKITCVHVVPHLGKEAIQTSSSLTLKHRCQ